MAAGNTTLADLAKMNGNDAVSGLIEENLNVAPEWDWAYARNIRGTSYTSLVREELPEAGFRAANEGVPRRKNVWKNVLTETYIFDANFDADTMIADAHEDGPAAFMALEGSGFMRAAMLNLASQMYYGDQSQAEEAAKGFTGLRQNVSDDMIVDAEGTTALTASSVFAIKFGPKECGFVWGQGGEIADNLGDLEKQLLEDGITAGSKLWKYVAMIQARIGFQFLQDRAVGEIHSLTEDAGKGLTDDLLECLFEKFPIGGNPDVIFMTKRSLKQLRLSRTAYHPLGLPAATPTEYNGVPIVTTDSIINTQPIGRG